MNDDSLDVLAPRIEDEEEIQEVTLVAWLKQVGDEVAAGEPIAEVMTDKVNVEIESPSAGTLKEILVEEDGVIAVGQPVARIKVVGNQLGA